MRNGQMPIRCAVQTNTAKDSLAAYARFAQPLGKDRSKPNVVFTQK